MSNSFAGSTTKSLNDLEREVETRMDKFTDEFGSPDMTFHEVPVGAKVKGGGEYQQPHDDFAAEADESFVHSEVKDQERLDDIDNAVQKYTANIKNPDEQFPAGKTMERLTAGVDDGLWSEAKDASQRAFGRIKWPFVNWWYEEHGGK